MRKYIYNVMGIILGFVPVLVMAQSASGKGFLDNWTRLLRFTISSLFPILISIGGLVFIFQIIRFIVNQSETEKEQLKRSIFINLAILFVMLTFFGIIKLVTNSVGVQLGVDISTASKVSSVCTKETVRGILMCILGFISKTMIPTAVAVAALVFIGNLVVYQTKTNNETERANARTYIMWSLIALMVMLGLFSIINIGTDTLFGSSSFIPQFPTSK